MRLREAIAMLALVVLAATACSRLTFIKPKAGRGNYEQKAPEYTFREDAEGKRRMAGMDQLALAERHLRAGEYDAAEANTRAAMKSDPKSPGAYTLLGAIEDQRGHSEKAGGYYAKAAELAPAKGNVLNNYGAWLCGNGRAVEALTWFDRALADPTYASPASALANAGSCAMSLGQTARADHDLRAALDLDPESPVALAAMAELQYRGGHFMEARAFSERCLAAGAASPRVLQLASQIEEKLGDTVAAARYVQRLRTEFPQARNAQPGEAVSHDAQ
ncbi:MAG: type IV pilus biogenesis/stability protein PilW [Luteimonas sp.]|nr:type IV pilus biogenesis/stability protein PilW [Luteimonas sp.]